MLRGVLERPQPPVGVLRRVHRHRLEPAPPCSEVQLDKLVRSRSQAEAVRHVPHACGSCLAQRHRLELLPPCSTMLNPDRGCKLGAILHLAHASQTSTLRPLWRCWLPIPWTGSQLPSSASDVCLAWRMDGAGTPQPSTRTYREDERVARLQGFGEPAVPLQPQPQEAGARLSRRHRPRQQRRARVKVRDQLRRHACRGHKKSALQGPGCGAAGVCRRSSCAASSAGAPAGQQHAAAGRRCSDQQAPGRSAALQRCADGAIQSTSRHARSRG